MARIIPDISGAFGMPRPHLQKFRRPRAPKRSGAQDAAEWMRLIQSGVGTAAGLYGLGRGIYEDFRETDEEAVARLQREAIEQRAKFMQPGAATLEFGVKPEFADPGSVGWTDEPRITPEAMSQTTPMRHFPSAQPPEMTQEQMLEGIAMGISPEQQGRRALDEPSYAPSAAPTREELVTLTEGVPEEWGVERLPFVTEAIERAQPASTLDTPDNRAIVQKAVEAAPTPEAKRALVDRVRAEGQSAIDKIAAHFGWTAEDIESLDPLQRAGLQLKGEELERAREQAERALPSAVTAREFLDRSFEGEQFNISDLASSYGGLMARGKEAEARELLRLARGAGDYASFITNPNEPPSLVEARARDAIKKGALAQPADVALTAGDLKDIASLRTPGRKRKASRKGRGKRRKGAAAEGAADDGIRRKVLKNVGIGRVDEMSDAQVQSAYKDAVNKAARGVYGKGKAAELKKEFGVDVLASDAAVKRAVGTKREERAVGAAETTAAAQTRRAKTDAEKAANKKKEAHKKSLADIGISYNEAVENPGNFAKPLKDRRTKVKASITGSQDKLSGNKSRNITRVKSTKRRATLREELKGLKAELATLTRAINTLNDIDQTPATFEPPAAFTVSTD